MGANDKHIIRYSRGSGRNFGKAKNKATSLKDFRSLFAKPTRTKERFKTYLNLPVDDQIGLKSVDGWFFRTQIEGSNRNAKSGKPTDIVTLDFDFALPDLPDRMELGLVVPRLEWFAHSSRRHTEDKPRLRVICVLSRPVANDEYGPLSRIIARMFDPGMTQVDKVSFRKAQMMFMPTTSIDGDWFFYANEGTLFDPDEILEEFERTDGDWRVLTNLPRVEGEEVREHADKAEDPTSKKGPVGDFCRAYDVVEAMAAFELPYEPADDSSEKPRYTYTGGTTSSGAVVEDGGLFLYSHHGSDPCADMLVNAFDLVRIHKFGHLDENESKDTPINQWPSFKAMIEFIQDDQGYKRQQAQSKYDQQAMFDDVVDGYWPEDEMVASEPEAEDDDDDLIGDPRDVSSRGAALAADRPKDFGKRKKPPKDWFPDQLELDKAGNILQNLPNAQTIIHNDPRLFGAIAYDDFTRRIVLRRNILSNMDSTPPCYCHNTTRGDIWQDVNDLTVRSILAAPNGKGKGGYGLDKMSERDLVAAVMSVALRNRFHPIKDYLWGCEMAGWDGHPRVDTLFVEYFGCPDNPYYRQTARMVLVASVARIFEPGHKFDFSVVLEGKGGIRKSGFIKSLFGPENFGELTCDMKDTKKIAETIGGRWAMELPEMTSFYKSDYNDAKQFLSAEVDLIRMAYDRRPSLFKRQTTFWGTNNNTVYLKDPTGNRRWWPIHVLPRMIDTARLEAERDQIWAEVMVIYKTMRRAQPTGDLPLYLSDPEAQRIAEMLQEDARTRLLYEEWADQILSWLETPVSLQQLRNEYGLGEKMPSPDEPDPEKISVLRSAFRVMDAARSALGIDTSIKNEQMTQNLDKAISTLDDWCNEAKINGIPRARRFGVRGRWKVRKNASAEELALGYRLYVPRADDDDISDLI